jgi:hypothetical protein
MSEEGSQDQRPGLLDRQLAECRGDLGGQVGGDHGVINRLAGGGKIERGEQFGVKWVGPARPEGIDGQVAGDAQQPGRHLVQPEAPRRGAHPQHPAPTDPYESYEFRRR